MPWSGSTGSSGSGSGGALAVRGTVANAAALPSDAVRGDMYVTRNDGHLHVFDGTWSDAGPIVGPAGVTPTLTGGTVTSLPAGAAPTFNLVKTGTSSYRVDVGLPVGAGDGSGGGSGKQSFRHVEDPAKATWTFVHDLDFEPAGVRIVDYEDSSIEWTIDVDYDAASKQFTLYFPQPVRGEVVVS